MLRREGARTGGPIKLRLNEREVYEGKNKTGETVGVKTSPQTSSSVNSSVDSKSNRLPSNRPPRPSRWKNKETF